MENTNTSRKINETVSTMSHDAMQKGQELKKNLEQGAEDVATQLRDGMYDIGTSIRKTGEAAFKQVSSKVNNLVNEASNQTKMGADKLEEEIRSYPLWSVFTGFGLGVVLGSCLFNRK